MTASSLGSVAVEGNVYDAFSRLITMTPTTLLTSQPSFTPQYEIMDYVSTGTGNIFVDISNTVVLLSANDGGGRAIRQTREYQLYQPGKEHRAIFTWCPHYSGIFDSSVAVRAGIYDDYRDKNTPTGIMGPPPFLYQSSINGGLGQETNQPSMGHYFELSGNEWFVVERANSSNNIANVTRVTQSNWNIDTLNSNFGNNPSGFQLSSNLSTGALFWIGRQWLGVGIVRMGMYFNGNPVLVHQFNHGIFNRPYTHLPKLPIRYEIEKVAGGSTSNAITASICESSHIGGEYTPFGTIFSLPGTIVNSLCTIDNTSNIQPILAIRLQQKYCRATFKIKDIELINTANQPCVFNIIKNPIITGPSFSFTPNPDYRSLIEYHYFGSNSVNYTVTGGQVVRGGFVQTNTQLQDSLSVDELLTAASYCSDVKGNPDIALLCAVRLGNNATIAGNMRWLEIVG